MILTVTLNPAIDKLYLVNGFKQKEVNRVSEVMNSAGGKGINVSRVAAIAGHSVTAMGFLGGLTGDLFESLITQKEIKKAFTKVSGETRYCVNVRDTVAQKNTELLEAGCDISEEDAQHFLQSFEQNLPLADVVTICGSMPKGLPQNFYGELIDIAKKHGKKVILDTSGAALKAAVEHKPTMIKPNADELKQLTNADVTDDDSIIAAAKKLCESGIEYVVVSRGKDGVLVVCESGVYRGTTPNIKVVNTVGCGDSMVAGFAIGMAENWSIEKSIQYAVAISTANAMHLKTGYYDKSDFDSVYNLCTVEKI